MAKYSASGSQTLTTSATSCLGITSNTSTVQRNWVYELTFGNVGTPADQVSVITVQRVTAPGTATSVTPTRLDLADREAQAVAGENHSSEPTYTSTEELMEVPLNHRATFRWVAAPGGEIVTPATNNFGAGFKSIHASATTDFRMGALWLE